MILQIEHHSGIPIYRQVMDQLRRQIVTGAINSGDQLESVRDLASRLKVNPMTISKAYSLLEAEGLLERKRGIGVFVAKVKKPKQQQIKNDLLKAAFEKAAVTSIQLNVSEDQAIEIFKKLYKHYNRRQK